MPISDEAKSRVRDAVRAVVRRELDTQSRRPDARVTIAGPWTMLDGGPSVWSVKMHASPDLYRRIRAAFTETTVKEILLAAAGLKVSRLCLRDTELAFLCASAEEYGFSVLAGDERYLFRRDRGKGNYCNAFERLANPDEVGGFRKVYVASDQSLVESAMLLEDVGDDELFGALLGIPRCCRAAYERFRDQAAARQFDLIPYVLENTPEPLSCDHWLNYATIYFGQSLLSFFPCSFRCPAAAVAARSTYEMLAECDPAWAASFLDLQRSNVLYTEYQGVHLFRSPIRDGWISYGPEDLRSTEPTETAALLRGGDRLAVWDKHSVGIFSGERRIGVLEGDDVAMCVFFQAVTR